MRKKSHKKKSREIPLILIKYLFFLLLFLVYASNLDQHIDRAMLTDDRADNVGSDGSFFQPEPTLLTIASGAPQVINTRKLQCVP